MYLLANADEYQYLSPHVPYVLDMVRLNAGIAAISSDQQLSLFDPTGLSYGPIRALQTSHGNITTVGAFDDGGSVVVTAGENGNWTAWDLRTASTETPALAQEGCSVTYLVGLSSSSISALACEHRTQSLATGTVQANYQASIMIWDVRSNNAPVVQYNELHSDDVTELKYHPENAHLLLSGSTDGLVNVCDTRIPDEDEVVVQAFNHGASIHRAGFLTNTEVFALSHNELLAIYDMAEDKAGSATADFGDVRRDLACQYVANVLPKYNQVGAVIGVGSQDQQNFRLIHLAKSPNWGFDENNVVGLSGAHGSEIVRSFLVVDEETVVFTGGEDGKIKAWKPTQ